MDLPVLLVHGILGQRHVYWNVLRRRLRRQGVRCHEVVLPLGLLGDLRRGADVLHERVEVALGQENADRVDLVCHSAGGLVARQYLQRHPDRVRHLVLLGTPNQGTRLGAAFAALPLKVREQTLPGSRFLEGLGPLPSGVRVTNLWSATDGIVLPARNALLPGAHNVRLPRSHHWGMLVQRSVHDRVLQALEEGEAQDAAGPVEDPSPR